MKVVSGASPTLLGRGPRRRILLEWPSSGLPGEDFTKSAQRVPWGPFPGKALGLRPGTGAAGAAPSCGAGHEHGHFKALCSGPTAEGAGSEAHKEACLD